jgi:uncharacterized protein (DUF4415 family)
MRAKEHILGSDLALSDAHTIAKDEYDELTDLSTADLLAGAWKVGASPASAAVGRVAFSAALKKQKINITLDTGVLAWYRSQAGGRGYQTLINATLREAMRGKQMTAALREVLREVIREELHPH